MSLCPPPTTCRIDHGVHGRSATAAKTARSGRTRRTVRTTIAIVPSTAAAAANWKPLITHGTLFTIAVSATENQVNSGP